MASNHTPGYGLSQWTETDPVSREDFNQDHQIIDAALQSLGNCKIVSGSYTGTGTYGTGDKATSLDFADTLGCAPKLLIVRPQSGGIMGLFLIQGMTRTFYSVGDNNFSFDYFVDVTWTQTGLTWSSKHAGSQYNETGTEYFYVAIA